MKKNPYYNPAHFELNLLVFEDDHACYSFDTLCFWVTKEGQFYTASDSGCSCPTPFEDYAGETWKDVRPLLERVENLNQALSIFNGWVQHNYRDEYKHDPTDGRRELTHWWAANHSKPEQY